MRWLASRRSQLADDRGSVTLEAAFGLAGIVSVAGLVLAAMSALALYISAVDTAGAAARAHALGLPFTPQRGSVQISDDGAWATATVQVPAPFIDISASATYPLEMAQPNR